MAYDTPFVLTEWEWFKLQLRLRALEQRGEYWVTTYNADEEHKTIQCFIWCKTTQQLIDKNAPIEKHRSFYDTWVNSERHHIKQILLRLPTLAVSFQVERDVIIEVLYNYGMGSTLVCRYQGDEFVWLYPDEEQDQQQTRDSRSVKRTTKKK
ncbi:MAG: hypothetical protein DYG89_13255 [Caldilinea sp. CFX5]|nr:hypothetical protein [Caldilinea sp. CFX5]